MQLDWKNKDISEKIAIIGGEAALAILPEVAMLKYGSAAKKTMQGIDKVDDISKVGNKVDDVMDIVNNKVAKKYGLSIDDLDTKGIISKEKDIAKNVDLGIGKYDHSSRVTYENGMELHVYKNPKTNMDDIYLMYDPKTEKNIAYSQRNTVNKDWKVVGDNSFHIKADMEGMSKDKVKFAMDELKKVLPEKHGLHESGTISTDGFRTWSQQAKHGYEEVAGKVTSPYISNAGKDNIFKGLDFTTAGDNFGAITFKTDKSAKEGLSRIHKVLKENNIKWIPKLTENRTLKVELPELQRLFGLIGATATGVKLINNKEDNETK